MPHIFLILRLFVILKMQSNYNWDLPKDNEDVSSDYQTFFEKFHYKFLIVSAAIIAFEYAIINIFPNFLIKVLCFKKKIYKVQRFYRIFVYLES